MILIWANFNAQLFIHLKLSMKCLELFSMLVHVRNSGGADLLCNHYLKYRLSNTLSKIIFFESF